MIENSADVRILMCPVYCHLISKAVLTSFSHAGLYRYQPRVDDRDGYTKEHSSESHPSKSAGQRWMQALNSAHHRSCVIVVRQSGFTPA